MSDMSRLFTSFFDTPTHTLVNARRWVPAMDLVEREDDYVLTADLPGVTPDAVKIDVADGVLTVSGERTVERDAKRGGYVRVERAAGRFARSLTLPKGVDAEAIGASFADGVLTVRVPKPASIKPRRIEIAVGGATPAIESEAAEPVAETSAA